MVSDVSVELNGETSQLIDVLGNDFTLIHISETAEVYLTGDDFKYLVFPPSTNKAFQEKYDCKEDNWYLIRPDHHIAARGRKFYGEKEGAFFNNSYLKAIGKYKETPAKTTNELFPKYQNDEKYKLLIDAHKGLTKEESELLNSKLILLLHENFDTCLTAGRLNSLLTTFHGICQRTKNKRRGFEKINRRGGKE